MMDFQPLDYSINTDRAKNNPNMFVATVAEFPDLVATGTSRTEVIDLLVGSIRMKFDLAVSSRKQRDFPKPRSHLR